MGKLRVQKWRGKTAKRGFWEGREQTIMSWLAGEGTPGAGDQMRKNSTSNASGGG